MRALALNEMDHISGGADNLVDSAINCIKSGSAVGVGLLGEEISLGASTILIVLEGGSMVSECTTAGNQAFNAIADAITAYNLKVTLEEMVAANPDLF